MFAAKFFKNIKPFSACAAAKASNSVSLLMFFFFYNAHNFSFRITLSFLWWFSWFSISTASCPSLHFFASATCSWRHSQVKIRMARAEQYISISFTNDIAICCYVNGMIFTKVNTDFVSSHVVLNNPFFDYDQMWCTGDNACVYYRLAPCMQHFSWTFTFLLTEMFPIRADRFISSTMCNQVCLSNQFLTELMFFKLTS